MNFKKLFSLMTVALMASAMMAQAPAGYYDSAQGKNKAALLKALEAIVGPHDVVSYKGLYTVYQTSDVTAEGYIWDMYATTKYSTGSGDRCGNYSRIGDCYNREHSFPKSWFNDASPMYSDAYHLYPTDGKVNGQRSNYPYGECANGTRLPSVGSIRALGKLGTSTFSGYSGTVFEPDDQYKGDFARTYFYMAAAYNSKIGSWNSPQLAGNSYPCFSSWSINLLMKWHRQDPVSEKEINRNNAVSKYQNNRNPFIDHPELAEYIWGNNTDSGWVPGGILNPMIVLPADGSNVNMGITGVNIPAVASIPVKGTDLSKDLTVTLSGSSAFSVTKTTITAAEAKAGMNLMVTYNSAAEGSHTATITIASSEASTTVNLCAEATTGIPAQPASDVATTSFNANWLDVDFEGFYSLNVMESDKTTSVAGYPVQVTTADECHTVTGLQPETQYYYQLSRGDRKSNIIAVTTASPEKVLTFVLPESGLVFSAVPGGESEILEAKVFTDYITEDITATITGEFEISLDKSSWSQRLTISPEGESIFVRMKKMSTIGEYSGVLALETATFEGEEAAVLGTVADQVTFFEDFEQPSTDSYATAPYEGTACTWDRTDVGLYGRTGDRFHGTQSACFGKTSASKLLMSENKLGGAGSVSFYAASYGSDETATIKLVYSIDGGQTWKEIEQFSTTAGDLQFYSFNTNIAGSVRIGFEQLSGKRVNIDDVSISNYSSGVDGIENNTVWTAYAAGRGAMAIESDGKARIEIYSYDAVKLYDEVAADGKSIINLPQGIYIVVSGDTSKKIIVK